MDVVDQLGAMREGKMSRRAFTRSLLASGVAIASVPVGARRAMAAAEDQGTYFTWGGYDIPELFQPYNEANGELPNFAVFGGSEEALTKMRGGFVVDVSHPCNSALPRWVKTGLFQSIDTSRLSNWPDVMPELVDLPGNMAEGNDIWMAPFDWGQTSITYRTDLIDLEGEEESWDILWDPKYKGKLGSLGAGADAWWIGAIKAGVPFDQLDTPEAFEKIAAVMREQRPLIRTYTDDNTTLEQALSSGEMVASMTWNSSAVQLQAEGVPVKFAKPKEGALTWVCGLMVHKDAPKLDKAYEIIDSLISVESGKFLIGDYGYGHSNKKAFDEFDEETLTGLGLSKNPIEILQAGHFQIPQTQEWETKMNEMFEQIKAGF
ncbi:extracellular solute-binding protein [Pseudohalocynthiibacter aestuariivivens]|uniref:Extracellular solute-binding protein n=1 Tax=Roseovarius pelagicus TaxID=2980108 RepID=A0ABY6DDQ8_9RHOB|nr:MULTISPECIES: extracellular solute-binding protein [Rhodobacterales]QIE47154.1 extracellular solute-binding protein [Pseudohalocynthiibacter aestuariivivens]UXX84292.1 extracellular solute-binding protein [Roseovarius pelagicus]